MLINLITVSQMDPYDPDSSDGGCEFHSQSTVPESPRFNDPNYETYKHGQQSLAVDHTANQRNGSEISKIWQPAGAVTGVMRKCLPPREILPLFAVTCDLAPCYA